MVVSQVRGEYGSIWVDGRVGRPLTFLRLVVGIRRHDAREIHDRARVRMVRRFGDFKYCCLD